MLQHEHDNSSLDTLPAADEDQLQDRVLPLLLDQRRRWQQGDRVQAEAYLADHPELGAEADAVLDLVYHEVLLREEAGEAPRLEEYVARFPQHSVRLRRQFVVHEGFDGSAPVGDAEAESSNEWPRVRGYEIVGRLGHGGVGVVYQARQLGVNRPVALKLIQATPFADGQQAARVTTEAEAAGRLRHPNIVQVYEAGEQDGRPFLSMELMEGGSLDKQLAGTPLPADEAAWLVETLARAIQYAHERGIVHRDLKPANILLTTEAQRHREEKKEEKRGTDESLSSSSPSSSSLCLCASVVSLSPKIADFGLAKCLDADRGQTETGAILGTPSYMAPEQAAGQARTAGPAVDVYALGAILYECLTGRPPFRAATPLETLEQVRSAEPVAPSRLQPKVPRDLETVCLKCLQKEAGKRYASAAALADDLRAFREGRPIQARPVGRLEKLGRWAQRNPYLAVTGGLAAVALVAVTAVSVVFAVTKVRDTRRIAKEYELARQEEQRALAAEQQARRRTELVRELTLASLSLYRTVQGLPLPASQRKALVDRLRVQIDALAERADTDASLQLLLGQAYTLIADVLGDPHDPNLLGYPEEALTLYQKALPFVESLAQAEPENLQHQLTLVDLLVKIGAVQRRLSQRKEAVETCCWGLKILEDLARKYPNEDQVRPRLATAYERVGSYQRSLRQYPQACESFRACLAIRERWAQEHPGDEENLSHVAIDYDLLGDLLHFHLKQPEEAEAYFVKSLALRQALIGRDPKHREGLADTLYHIGNVRRSQSDYEKALECFRQALQIVEESFPRAGDLHRVERQHFWAILHWDVSEALQKLGRPGEALDVLRPFYPRLRERADHQPDNLKIQRELIRLCRELGALNEQMRSDAALSREQRVAHVREARTFYQRALEVVTRLRESGRLVESDAKLPETLPAEIARCDAELAKLKPE